MFRVEPTSALIMAPCQRPLALPRSSSPTSANSISQRNPAAPNFSFNFGSRAGTSSPGIDGQFSTRAAFWEQLVNSCFSRYVSTCLQTMVRLVTLPSMFTLNFCATEAPTGGKESLMETQIRPPSIHITTPLANSKPATHNRAERKATPALPTYCLVEYFFRAASSTPAS
jgi:hypothetical protein